MKFGEWENYGPKKSWLNFGISPERILDIVNILSLSLGQLCITTCDATKFLLWALLSLLFHNCQ